MDVLNNMKKADEKVKGFWGKRTTGQKVQLLLLALVTALAIGAAVFFTNKTEYAVLFAGMTQTEAAQIYEELKAQSIDVKTRGTDTLLVPSRQVDDLRWSLINQGLPESGFTYDLTLNSSSFGKTDADKKIMEGLQLEQNIAQSIKAIGKVESAMVKVTLAEKGTTVISTAPTKQAQASVMLTLKRGEELTSQEAQSMFSLIEKSVPSLSRENISIVDTKLRQYQDVNSSEIGAVDDRLALQIKHQKMIESQVSNLLAPIYGADNFTVAANVVMNFDDKKQTSVKYEPPTDADNMGIIISQAQTDEYIADPAAGPMGNVGVDPNGGQGLYAGGAAGANGSYYKQTKEFNAEINELREQTEMAKGGLESLNISIIINGEAAGQDEVSTQMSNAIAKAVGVDQENISLMFMPFNYKNQAVEEEKLAKEEADAQAQPTGQDLTLIYILIGAGLLLILIVVVVVMLLSGKKRKRREEEAAAAIAQQQAEEDKAEQLEDAHSEFDDVFGKNQTTEVIEQVRKMVDRNPESVAQLLRNWLLDEYGRR